MDKKKQILARAGILYLGIGLLALAIFGQIIRIQFFEGNELRERSRNLTLELESIQPLRGNIFSSDGNFLAISLPIYEIRMDMKADGLKKEQFNKHIDSLCWNLSNLFKDKSKEEYKKMLKAAYKEGNRYQLVQENVGYTQLQKLRKFPLFREGPNKGGLAVIPRTKRIKPYKELASRTIGKASGEGNFYGIEYFFNEELAGTEGVRLVQKLQGNLRMPVNDNYEIEPRNGSDIYTTIDISLQEVLHNELQTQLSKNNADHGTAIVMEVTTGAIKAIANLQRAKDGSYYEGDNFAVREAEEPGSTFKLATIMAALEDGVIKPTDTIATGNGVFSFNGIKMKDSHEGGYGNITVQQVFEKSSNVGTARIVWDHYRKNPEKFTDRLRQFHLHEPTGIQLAGEAEPRIKSPKDADWSGISLPWISIGYESKITPLQMLTFYNAVANDGKMVRPRIVNEIREHGKQVRVFETEYIDKKIASDATIQAVRRMMEGVVKNGTARNLGGLVYSIAGKTGTAQISKRGGGYREGGVTYRASFAGYFPADKPKYSCIVVISAPSNNVYYGNTVSGPVFKAAADKIYAGSLDLHERLNKGRPVIADSLLPYVKPGAINDQLSVLNFLNISSSVMQGNSPVGRAMGDQNKIRITPAVIRRDVLPDVKGMGARDATYMLEKLNCKVEIIGRGSIRNQEPAAGSAIKKGMTVKLYLNV